MVNNLFGSRFNIFIIGILILLTSTASAETITFTNLRMASEFTSSNQGDTPIGHFFMANSSSLNISVNAYYKYAYQLVVYINNAPTASGDFTGTSAFIVTISPENLNLGENTIFVRVRNKYVTKDMYGFDRGSNFDNVDGLIIYGTSKISSDGISLPPILTPTPTPIPTPTPTLTLIPTLPSTLPSTIWVIPTYKKMDGIWLLLILMNIGIIGWMLFRKNNKKSQGNINSKEEYFSNYWGLPGKISNEAIKKGSISEEKKKRDIIKSGLIKNEEHTKKSNGISINNKVISEERKNSIGNNYLESDSEIKQKSDFNPNPPKKGDGYYEKGNFSEENLEKGDMFEDHISTLFNEYFSIERNQAFPDFLIKSNSNRDKFAVECKWKKQLYEDSFWIEERQFINYKEYQNEYNIPFFMVLGLGGTASEPDQIFIIPLKRLQYRDIKKHYLDKFKRKNKYKPFFYYPETKDLS